MGLCAVPAFSKLNAKAALVNSADPESKSDSKDSNEKEDAKDKLSDIDQELTHFYLYAPVLTAANFFYHHQQLLYHQSHHPAVLTPPPDFV
ncbi:hypothetical protein GCM10027037_34180 [Mucilaginibacter koreensis]